jgi:hypothetical protein
MQLYYPAVTLYDEHDKVSINFKANLPSQTNPNEASFAKLKEKLKARNLIN